MTKKYRPDYHFTPERNWMNDPNGMVFFDGEYHLFYQFHPYGTTWGPMHWGHAASPDMVHWEHFPVALEPDEHGAIFSGSAVVDWNDTSGFFNGNPGLVAIFTHHDQTTGSDRFRQRQSLAYSSDSGRSWTKYAGNPVLVNEKYSDFRDPKVFWHQSTKRWVMILASGQTVCIYHSQNLKSWTYASEFGQSIGSHNGVWECPDLFPLPVGNDSQLTKWVMFVSIGNSSEHVEGSRTQYFIGKFDGNTFVLDGSPDHVKWLDYGRDNYAGVSWSDIPIEDGRRIYIGWMSNWKYANMTPTEGWRSSMTVPRMLSLEPRNGEIALIQRPVRELEKLRVPVLSLKQTTVESLRERVAGLNLDSFEIIAELETAYGENFAVKVRTSVNHETVIGYDAAHDEMFIDRTRSGEVDFHPDFAGRHAAKLGEIGAALKLHIYVDQSSVEVFADDGRIVLSDLIYPGQDENGLEISSGGSGRILLFEVFNLRAIGK